MKIVSVFIILCPLILFQSTSTVKIPNKDTVEVNGTSTQKVYFENDDSFFERYQTLLGSFIGAAAAALIAFISIRVTHNKQLNLENKKTKEHYQGILISIKSIIISHKEMIKALNEELKALSNDFKKRDRLAYEKPKTFIPIDLLKELFIKLTEYSNFNIEILYFLSGYIISNDNLYNDLDFQSINKLKEEADFKEKMDNYFKRLLRKVEELGEGADKIKNMLDTEINKLLGVTKEAAENIKKEEQQQNKG